VDIIGDNSSFQIENEGKQKNAWLRRRDDDKSASDFDSLWMALIPQLYTSNEPKKSLRQTLIIFWLDERKEQSVQLTLNERRRDGIKEYFKPFFDKKAIKYLFNFFFLHWLGPRLSFHLFFCRIKSLNKEGFVDLENTKGFGTKIRLCLVLIWKMFGIQGKTWQIEDCP
jgi:hypothetical protein